MENINYLELAKEQFRKLKNEALDDDRHCIGSGSEQEYNIDGIIFKIEVDGFWEKVVHFDWIVYDYKGNRIDSGSEG